MLSGALVGLVIGDCRLALPLATVERVVAMVAIEPLPGAPEGVVGAVNVHGEVVPVLDLGARLGLPPASVAASASLVLARTQSRRVALPVDEALGVVDIGAAAISAPQDTLAGPLAGLAALDDGLLVIYDLDAFLSASEEETLRGALAEATH